MCSPVRMTAPSGTAAEHVTHELFIVKKDTKSRLLGKLLAQYHGSILLFSRTKHNARKIARTFQLVDLFKEMSVIENVMIACFSHRATQQRAQGEKPWKTAMVYLEEMGLGNRFNEKAKNLAFGELRLLDIARAMATQPDILLLDEPFSGLDMEDAAVLSSAIQRMHKKGQTMVIIEHRLRDLLKLVERVVAIVFGEKIAEGSPAEIMNNPKVVNAYLGERRD